MTQQTPIVTKKAMLIHSFDKPGLDVLGARNSQETIITVHDIKRSRGTEVMGVGKMLSAEDKAFLINLLNGNSLNEDQWLPDNILMMNSRKVVWFVPGKRRKMHFKLGQKKSHHEVIWPSLCFFHQVGKQLRIAAYAGSRRPKIDQPLYHAPLWNIYEHTGLCSGSCETPGSTNVDAISTWEEAIFNSYFTHANHSNVLANGKSRDTKYLKVIRSKEKSGKPFFVREMVPLRKTLREWAR
jgi:PRTRC genetic system protein B